MWTLYRHYAFSGLVMAIVASFLVRQTDRGDEMFMTMASRHAHQALDLDSESLLGRPRRLTVPLGVTAQVSSATCPT